MPKRNQKTGQLGEDMACHALLQRGYEIIERNWRCAAGEIDIVARDGACWAFVEVKTRHGHASGLAEEALTERKAQRLVGLAETYLAEQELGQVDWRIDLIAIELDHQNTISRLNLIPGLGIDV